MVTPSSVWMCLVMVGMLGCLARLHIVRANRMIVLGHGYCGRPKSLLLVQVREGASCHKRKEERDGITTTIPRRLFWFWTSYHIPYLTTPHGWFPSLQEKMVGWRSVARQSIGAATPSRSTPLPYGTTGAYVPSKSIDPILPPPRTLVQAWPLLIMSVR